MLMKYLVSFMCQDHSLLLTTVSIISIPCIPHKE